MEQMGQLPGTVWIALTVLIVFLLIDILYPKSLTEGFKVLVGSNVEVVDSSENYFSRYFPKRGDVGPFKEEKNYIMDPRYFHDYVDVQGLGFKHDYCRLVIPENAIQTSLGKLQVSEDAKKRKLYGEYANAFLACALAGTGNTPSTTFKSKTVANGLQLSRDDYMRDIYNDNRYAYCRILKKDNIFQSLCIITKRLIRTLPLKLLIY